MKTRQRNNPKKSGSQQSQSRRNASTSSSSTEPEIYIKETQSTSSQRPSLLERMNQQSLLERLSSPISRCLTIGTGNVPSVTQMSSMKRSERRSPMKMPSVKDTNGCKESMEMNMTPSAMSRSTDDQKSTQSSSPGPCRTEWKAAQCEMSVLQPETLSLTTPLTSNSPNRTSSTQGQRPSSPTQSGSRYCRVSPSTLTLYSAGGTQL